jgi:deglycase
VGSHELVAKYKQVPARLRDRLVGTDYLPLPVFTPADPESLKGYRVALVTTHGPELPEFDIPLTYLRQRGATVDVVTQDWLFDSQPEAPGVVVLAQWLAVNVCAQADKKVSDAKIQEYDGIIIIGGAWNPIMLRTDDAIKMFVRNAQQRRLLIAAICHGPQVLISSKAFPPGTRATSVSDVRIDLANAGFKLPEGPDNEEAYDKAYPIVYDESQRLITSPNPYFLKQFCEEIDVRIREAGSGATTRGSAG